MFPNQLSPALLSPADTVKFIKQTDLAFRLLDVSYLEEVLQRYQLHELPDTRDFLRQAEQHLSFWEYKPVRIEEVTSFDSRCIACSFGKSVKGYEVKYSQGLLKKRHGPRTHYSLKFAFNYLLEDDCLVDFAWCNGFLNKDEMVDERVPY